MRKSVAEKKSRKAAAQVPARWKAGHHQLWSSKLSKLYLHRKSPGSKNAAKDLLQNSSAWERTSSGHCTPRHHAR